MTDAEAVRMLAKAMLTVDSYIYVRGEALLTEEYRAELADFAKAEVPDAAPPEPNPPVTVEAMERAMKMQMIAALSREPHALATESNAADICARVAFEMMGGGK